MRTKLDYDSFFCYNLGMDYKVEKDKIVINDASDFNIEHILECGQIFTYKKLEQDDYVVFSKDKTAHVYLKNQKYIIETNAPLYFVNFFDLNTDYSKIKGELAKNNYMKNAVKFGYGIRILKQDLLEVIVGFVISSNNNIERIKKTMAKIRECGEDKGEYHSFPTIKELEKITLEQFKSFGCGYRASYLVKLINQIKDIDLKVTENMETVALKKWLLSLCGVGPKVADCILLFGYHRCDSFPVDTWIEKVYFDIFKTKKSPQSMSKDLVEYFGDLSGYAQQYLFFYKRSLNTELV